MIWGSALTSPLNPKPPKCSCVEAFGSKGHSIGLLWTLALNPLNPKPCRADSEIGFWVYDGLGFGVEH